MAKNLKKLLPELKKFNFQAASRDENSLLWIFTNLMMFFALNAADKKQRERFGDYPLLHNGSYGFISGYDNDYQNHHFNGIYGHCENEEHSVYFSVQNYRVIEKFTSKIS